MKAIGAVMLLCGCAGLGVLRTKQMDKRIRTLRSFVCALEAMERELTFRVPLLEEMLAAAARPTKGPVKAFFLSCRNELNNGANEPFCEIWHRVAREQLCVLEKEDLIPVLTLGGVLGRYDGDGQLRAIVRTQKALEQECLNALSERSSKGKVYQALSAAAGLFLLILLL